MEAKEMRSVVVIDGDEFERDTRGAKETRKEDLNIFGTIVTYDSHDASVKALVARLTAEGQRPAEYAVVLCEVPEKRGKAYARCVTEAEANILIDERTAKYERMWDGCGCRKPNYSMW